jgi:two-component system response regulator (stage 0 sporulation protein A)
VPEGFYLSSAGGIGTSFSSSESCRQCNGTGIIWGQDETNACTISENNSNEGKSISKTLEQAITDILHNLGMQRKMLGFNYARFAIMLSVRDKSYIQNITKMLYPAISKEFHTEPSRAERAIRHGIEIAWSRGNVEAIESMFGCSVNANKGKPTNSEFIATIADNLRLKGIPL